MRIVYRLPQFFALFACGAIAMIVYQSVKFAKTANLFDLIEYEGSIVKNSTSILGMDAYLVLMMIGLFFAVLLAVFRRKLLDIRPVTAVLIAVAFFLQAYLGAKILFGIEHVITEQSLAAFAMDGQSLYGTIPMTLIFIPVLARIIKRDTKKLFDYIAPLWLTLLVFVRLGCFTIGCCGADGCVIAGVEVVLPVQLIEVALDLIILQIIFNMEVKRLDHKNKDSLEGLAFFIMIGLYGIYRFFLEFIRNNDVILLGMTFGHIYSVICVLAVAGYVVKRKRSSRKPVN